MYQTSQSCAAGEPLARNFLQMASLLLVFSNGEIPVFSSSLVFFFVPFDRKEDCPCSHSSKFLNINNSYSTHWSTIFPKMTQMTTYVPYYVHNFEKSTRKEKNLKLSIYFYIVFNECIKHLCLIRVKNIYFTVVNMRRNIWKGYTLLGHIYIL